MSCSLLLYMGDDCFYSVRPTDLTPLILERIANYEARVFRYSELTKELQEFNIGEGIFKALPDADSLDLTDDTRLSNLYDALNGIRKK